MVKRKPIVLFVVGPTASGKSALAVALAKKLGGEVLSADSMLVYKGMDIGTAKPTKKERGGIRHHGLDLIPPTKSFSVFTYRQFALKAIKDIVKRGKIPIVAGGTGFYIRALLEGLSPLPGSCAPIRRELEREAQTRGLPALYERLLKLDPSRAKAIGPHNQRRILRALEIYQVSGKKPSEALHKTPGLLELGYKPVVVGIHRDREALYQKINRRVDAMFQKGLVREVKRLGRKKLSKTALQGVGYKETLDWIRHQGEEPLVEVKNRIKQTTRHFAKRQWTWFKREKDIRWIWWPERSTINDVCHYIRFHILDRLKDVGCRMSEDVTNSFSSSIIRHPKGGR
jgi:tRNA dimethylallyltransferase